MIITKIEQQKRHPERVNLYLDGEFVCGLHKEVIVKFSLRKGDKIDQELLDKLSSQDQLAEAKSKALRILSRRLRTEYELRTKLLEKKYSPKIVDEVIKYLSSIGFINDTEIARLFIHDYQLRKPAGKRLLTLQLRQKGISKSIIQEALINIDDHEEEKSAYGAARKQLIRYRTSRKILDPTKQQRRIAQFLQRRGFRWSTISLVLKKIFQDASIPFEV